MFINIINIPTYQGSFSNNPSNIYFIRFPLKLNILPTSSYVRPSLINQKVRYFFSFTIDDINMSN
ncbi:hypothetical protein SGA02_04220 [Staphylococcus gallinarum]|uniref:Uncharacterized protein n=1 Tax=Staphylococcus gallinarum TaxID=1293 RepID=A0ABQ0XYX3_STAGA|nr:hypothetical protein SGA02_04220 [Staphylococcus gallinarum]